MTNKEERPAGCVLRLFGAPEQTVQKAVEALPDTWQGTVHCRSRGAETLVALQSSTPQQLHRAVQQLRTSLALALYGEGEQTLAAAAVQALEQHRKLLVCSDTAAGALLETRLENLPGAEKVFDFGAMSYANTALTARLSRKLRKAPQAEPARTLARVQVMQKLTGAALTVGCVELPQSRLLLVGGKKGCWLRCLASDENPGLWLLDMLRRAAPCSPDTYRALNAAFTSRSSISPSIYAWYISMMPSAQPSQDAEMLPIASSTICWRSSRVVSLIRMLVIGKNRSFQAAAFTPSMSGGSFCICSR